MHLAFDARMVAYRRAGIGQYCLRLLAALAALPSAVTGPAFRVTVLQSRKDRTPVVIGDPRFRRVGLWTPPHNRWEQIGLAGELQRLWPRPTVIHSPDFIPPFVRPAPAVVTVHDLAFLRFPDLLTAESARYYGQIHRAVASAEAIIAVSHSTARDCVELAGADPAKIHVIYEAADAHFHPPPLPASAEDAPPATWQSALGYVLFVSTLEPRKNLTTLLEAYALLRDGGRVRPLPPLRVVGERGWLYETVYQRYEELRLGDAVQFMGGVDAAALPALYAGAWAFVMPSLYEGFGLGALEALACGTPVLAANAGALPEVVGDAGLLLPPTDPAAWAAALEQVLLDPVLNTHLRSAGPPQAARFSWDRAARETLAVYRAISHHEAHEGHED